MTANISGYPLDPLNARGPRLERIAEVLGLMSDLPLSKFHDAYRVRWQAVICEDEFADPKIVSAQDAFNVEPLFIGLGGPRKLDLPPATDSLS